MSDGGDVPIGDANGSNGSSTRVRPKGTNEQCFKCNRHSSATKYCGGCKHAVYCTSTCQKEDWPNHKLICKSVRGARERAKAQHDQMTAPGASTKRNIEMERATVDDWYNTAPGLCHKVQFLAWKHRAENPIIKVTTPSLSYDSVRETEMMPKSKWADVSRANHEPDMALGAHTLFAGSDFKPDVNFLVYINISAINTSGAPFGEMSVMTFAASMRLFSSLRCSTLTADEFAADCLRIEKDPTLGTGALPGFPEVARSVRIIGLIGAAHLNGKEGVLKCKDVNNPERTTIRLECGKEINVRPQNYVIVQRMHMNFGGESAVYVRIIGLTGAAQLNGRNGVMKGQDPNNSERTTIRLECGKEVNVRSDDYVIIQIPMN